MSTEMTTSTNNQQQHRQEARQLKAVTPPPQRKLGCSGRACSICGYCHDWYRDYNDDWKRDRGATCRHFFGPGGFHGSGGFSFFAYSSGTYPLCQCR